MRIGSDINSLSIVNRLNQTNRAVSRALERLSTGKRVNSSRDDSASFSLSVNLEAQVRGLRQGILNLNQSQSALEIADSAIGSQLELVQRMRELAVQASNGSLSSDERLDLDRQLRSLFDEFKRITNDTEFNGNKLLDGSFDLGQVHLGLSHDSVISLGIDSTQETEIFTELQGTGGYTDTNYSDPSGSNTIIGDLNDDGLDDIIYTRWPGGIGIELSNGDGTFQSVRTYDGPISTYLYEIRTADVNNDNIVDILYNTGNTLVTYLGNGDGTFDARKTLTVTLSDFEVGDFNEDGNLDIITTGNSSLELYTGNGDGTYTISLTRSLPSGIGYEVKSADFNEDGHLDLALGTNSRDITILLGNGNGSFAQGSTITTVTYNIDVQHITLGDLNNDGNVDIVSKSNWVNGFASFSLNYVLGNGDGTFGSPQSFVQVAITGLGNIADMNGDGLPDIIDNGGYYRNLGNGLFSSTRQDVAPQGIDPGSGFAGDFNGDGINDIFTIDYDTYGANVYLGNSRTASAVDELSVKTQVEAQNLLGILDTAIENLVSRQAEIGSLHTRLDFATSNNLLLSENLEEARIRATDADLAEETAELVKQQILQQAQVAVLAQANLQVQTVVLLLSDL